MPTPGELKKITEAVASVAADLLSRDSNAEISAEELAIELAEETVSAMISAYEEIQAKSYNLIVLGHFRLNEEESYVAAVGPLSTRAHQRARGVGEHFAWDYKTRRGSGKYVLVPLIRNPNEAWDHLRKEQRPPAEVQESLKRASALSLDPTGPACVCGLREDLVCPRHPEGHDVSETP